MRPDCLVCRELDGGVELPGGVIWEEDLVAAFHVPPLAGHGDPYLGHLLVVTHRHVAGLGELSDDEAAAVGRGAARMARALVAAGATWVHSAVVGLNVPHFHQHLLPRFRDTPHAVRWHAVDEWGGARHGGAAEVAEFVGRLRASLA